MSVQKNLADVGILQSVLGIIDTENYEYSELFNEINVNTGGIGTSLELYNNVTRVKEKEFKATFEIKGKALYSQLEKTFAMMAEILTASKLDDTKRNPGDSCYAEIKADYEVPVFWAYDSSTSCTVLCITVC